MTVAGPCGADEKLAGRIVTALDGPGWITVDRFVDDAEAASLARECRALREKDRLRRAGVGVGANWQLRGDVRTDRVCWLEAGDHTPAQTRYLWRLEQLRGALNRAFFLGLFEFEGHFAVYPPGAFYRRHLDQFRGAHHRRVSIVLYLNAAWTHADGGALRLYLGADGISDAVDILPEGGRAVIFWSERFHHEVLPAARERMSLTGWLRTRA